MSISRFRPCGASRLRRSDRCSVQPLFRSAVPFSPAAHFLRLQFVRINTVLTMPDYAGVSISRMPQDFLRMEDRPGAQPGQRVLTLEGALVLTTMFEFQSTV